MSFTYCISTTHNGTLVVHEGDTCPLCDALKQKLTIEVGKMYEDDEGRVFACVYYDKQTDLCLFVFDVRKESKQTVWIRSSGESSVFKLVKEVRG